MNAIDHLVPLLRSDPWLTAREAAARLGLPVNSVRNALNRWSTGPYARLRRINGRYRYALVHEPNPPAEDA